jgi:hypothetical protein
MNQNKTRTRSIIYKPLAIEKKKLRQEEKKDKEILANIMIG